MLRFHGAVAEVLSTIAGEWRLSTPNAVRGLLAEGTLEGAARFSEPNNLGFGPLGMTLMTCPQPVALLEQEYLSRLQAVTIVGFDLEKLVLSWQIEGAHGTLLFVPRQ